MEDEWVEVCEEIFKLKYIISSNKSKIIIIIDSSVLLELHFVWVNNIILYGDQEFLLC